MHNVACFQDDWEKKLVLKTQISWLTLKGFSATFMLCWSVFLLEILLLKKELNPKEEHRPPKNEGHT